MSIPTTRQDQDQITGRRRGLAVALLGTIVVAAALTATSVVGAGFVPGALYYSTAPAPRDFVGPRPTVLALNDTAAPRAESATDRAIPAPLTGPDPVPAAAPLPEMSAPAPPAANARVVAASNPSASIAATPAPAPLPPPARTAAPPPAETPQVASVTGEPARPARVPESPSVAPSTPAEAPVDPIVMAKQAIAECQARFRQVQDYTCVFQKRERVGGRLTPLHVMVMKARTNPSSVYFKFQQPNRGREAIYVHGRNGGKILAHDVGLGKVIAGTMRLDPRGSMAMEDTRHPITEAGLGNLIETVARHWAVELIPEYSQLVFHPNVRVGSHPCTMIESIHPQRKPTFMFYKVKLYIDHEHGLPIRFEAYDWPKHPGGAPELVEEYTYLNLKTNIGLRDADFDPANRQYSFGRF